MEEKYQIINLNEYLSNTALEQEVLKIINTFQSPRNEDVESFLKKNAILFTRKGQSITYLVFRDAMEADFVGYFSLTIKPITIKSESIPSKTFRKRIERVCKADDDGAYVISAYLIAQLGKNYNLEESKRIEGRKLLEIAHDTLSDIKNQIGGVIVFLECEDSENDFLKKFYSDNGFTLFDERISEKSKKLYQLIRTI